MDYFENTGKAVDILKSTLKVEEEYLEDLKRGLDNAKRQIENKTKAIENSIVRIENYKAAIRKLENE